MESHWRKLRIPSHQPPEQFIRWHIEEMHFAPRPKLLRSRAIVFTFFACPKAKIKYHIRSQHKRPTGHLPKQGLNESMPGVMLWLFCILTEETQLPFIGRESKRRALIFKLSR